MNLYDEQKPLRKEQSGLICDPLPISYKRERGGQKDQKLEIYIIKKLELKTRKKYDRSKAVSSRREWSCEKMILKSNKINEARQSCGSVGVR